ncbi:MAG: NifB/NifX family molybdenum-iron cluster-binding protein [Caldisericia bacterium]
MKICLTSTGNNLESFLDPRFGRCNYFVIVDTDTMNFKAIKNDASEARSGAGVKAAQFVINEGVDVLITGDIGPNAKMSFESSNIKIITGIEGSIKEIIENFKKENI